MTTTTGYVPSETTDVLTATIASSGTVSDALDIGQHRLAALQFGTMTGTAMTFQASSDFDGTYVAVYDDAGAALSITIASDTVVGLDSVVGALAACRYIKLVSGSAEGAEREIKVILRA